MRREKTAQRTPDEESTSDRGRHGCLIALLVIALLFGSCVHRWPHYKASAPGAHVTEKMMFMRLTWGEQVHLPLADGAELAARSICYPPAQGGYQPCHLIVELRIRKAMEISFTRGLIVARHPADLGIRFASGGYDTRIGNCPTEAFEAHAWCTAVSTSVHLDYEMPPSVFELLVPGVTINDENIAVPPIRFEYDDFLAYQFVPLLVNF